MRRLLVPLAAAAVLAAGCGGSDSGDSGGGSSNGGSSGGGGNTQASSEGKTLFSAKCGSCHTLKDAGTGGTFGPNLDELKPDKATVLEQIANGGGGMPPKLYSGAQADTVATYVSTVAGRS